MSLRLEFRDPPRRAAAARPYFSRLGIAVFRARRLSAAFRGSSCFPSAQPDEVGKGHSEGSRSGFNFIQEAGPGTGHLFVLAPRCDFDQLVELLGRQIIDQNSDLLWCPTGLRTLRLTGAGAFRVTDLRDRPRIDFAICPIPLS